MTLRREEEIKKLVKEIVKLEKKIKLERRREIFNEDYQSDRLDLELDLLIKEGRLSLLRKELLINVNRWNGVKYELCVLNEAESKLFSSSAKIPRVVPDTYLCGVLVKALEA